MSVVLRVCAFCKRTIKDTESCWRDHAGRYICNECDQKGSNKRE